MSLEPTTVEEMAVTLELSATHIAIDEALGIRVTGLEPNQEVTVRLSLALADRWSSSHASFVAPLDGTVDLGVLAPVGGTYAGVDAMGLFWSVGKAERRSPPTREDRGCAVISVELGGHVVARSTLFRSWARPEVRDFAVHDSGLVGQMYWRPDRPPRPAVIVLGGSEGGLGRWSHLMAAGLASNGYNALALAYFGCETLPPHLSLIPLEYFQRALEWLAQHPGVDGDRLAVLGASRGGELALLLGATLPNLSAVVAYSPSHVVWSEIAFGFRRRRSAWSHGGSALPFVDIQLPMSAAVAARVMDKRPEAVIPVERIKGGVLAISGDNDTLWPSSLMAERVMQRLREHNHPHPAEHLRYTKAGHAICRPYTATRGMPHGGTAEGMARANEDSWRYVLTFLTRCLAGSGPVLPQVEPLA